HLHLIKPVAQLSAEIAVRAIFSGPEVVGQPIGCEQRNSNDASVQLPGFPDEPEIKIEDAGRICEGSDDLALYRNAVLVDLLKKGVADDHGSRVRYRG